ncbi:helix-turn-helix domain-containing protein [Parapedobacter tibetensis]|uniref:helix-turn-helix domain-containing protein n=1 Tax=Parapedobacter tibetensis TaxID=2972951 RepID=UPI00214D2B88|nr:helix-turn-helix domain-containing protein [Parapedobacter tibetensis]
MDVSTKLKLLRERHSYTQEFVASKLGISQSTYFNLEAGNTKLSVKRAAQLAEIYGIPASFFFDNACTFTNYNIGDFSRTINRSEISNSDLKDIKLLYEKLLQEKDLLIDFLTNELNVCKKEKKILSELLNVKLAQNI